MGNFPGHRDVQDVALSVPFFGEAAITPHPSPSPKEKGLEKPDVQVLSFGEDYSNCNLCLKGIHGRFCRLGEALRQLLKI